jgi:uncharacterized protein DUF3631
LHDEAASDDPFLRADTMKQERITRTLATNPSLFVSAEALPPLDREKELGTDGACLLHEIENFVSRFVVLPPDALLPLALWIIGTYIFDAFEAFPYLVLLSPEKGCGKTRTTEVIEQLAANPVRAVSASEAAIFRMIELLAPTLVFDEAEMLSGTGDRAEAVRALLNAGNRSGAKVPRCVGQAHEIRMFSVYCPKLICAIRVCPETVRDRAVVVSMQRKKPSESVERFILRRIRPQGKTLRDRLATWTKLNRAAIVTAYERLDVDFLSDRDLENFEPLLALLTVADTSRLAQLRQAAERLTTEKAANDVDDSLSLRLLSDVRDVWQRGEAYIFSVELLKRLRAVPDAPWAEDVRLNPRKLARMLRGYGCSPRTVRVGTETGKGYARDEFEAPFLSYLSSGAHEEVT